MRITSADINIKLSLLAEEGREVCLQTSEGVLMLHPSVRDRKFIRQKNKRFYVLTKRSATLVPPLVALKALSGP